jgi:hypothetical protein
LNSVDFPTFGRPTIATVKLMTADQTKYGRQRNPQARFPA